MLRSHDRLKTRSRYALCIRESMVARLFCYANTAGAIKSMRRARTMFLLFLFWISKCPWV